MDNHKSDSKAQLKIVLSLKIQKDFYAMQKNAVYTLKKFSN